VAAESHSIYLATNCHGGQAHAGYMQSLLALRPACAVRGVGLQIDLGGGEALIGRARAAAMAKFLASQATHLLFIDSDTAFEPQMVFRLLETGDEVSEDPSLLLIARSAAQRMTDEHPQLRARLDDVHAGGVAIAAMVFDPLIDAASGRYLTDRRAFGARWRAIRQEGAANDVPG
jgi:hypothetical protein